MSIEELVLKFHSLDGECVGEMKKNFNLLLAQIKRHASTDADLRSLIKSIKPVNHLEEILKLDILIHFDRYDELLDVLKGGNVLLIARISKRWRFFERCEYFKSIDGASLVNEVLSHVSFKTRMKIINRLSKTVCGEAKADDLFNAIHDNYGLKVAIPLLTMCSTGTLKAIVKKYKIRLTSRQLLKIVKRDCTFLIFYYQNVFQNKQLDFSNMYKQALKYVAKYDTRLFWKLCDDHNLTVRFGRHMSPYVLKCGGGVLSNNIALLEMFHPKEIIHEHNFEQFFTTLYPNKVKKFSPPTYGSTMSKLLKHIPKAKRFELVSRCFSEAYKKPLSDFPHIYTVNILVMMPVEERELVLDEKIDKYQQLIYLYRPEISISILVNRIECTKNVAQCKRLIKQLYKTCEFHNDEKHLLSVIKYFYITYKNDAVTIRDFLEQLVKWPNLHKLTNEHWIYINYLMKIVEVSGIYFYTNKELVELHIRHLIEKQKPFKEKLKTLIKSSYETYQSICLYYLNDSITLAQIAFLIPEIFDGQALDRVSLSFLATLLDHNKYYPNDPVAILDYHELIQAASNFLECTACQVAIYFIKMGIRFEEFDKMLWNNYQHIDDLSIVTWYAKNKPQTIANNLDVILNRGYLWDDLINTLKTLSHWKIPQRIATYCVDVLKHDDYENASFALETLSHFAKDSFFEAVEPFRPPDDGKINLAESQDKLSLHETIAKSLRNIERPEMIVNLLLKFCIGDYLKYVSVCGLASNLQQKDLNRLLRHLHESAVSVRNHGIILKSTVSDRRAVYNFLKTQGSVEKSASLRTVIFARTRIWFVDESDELFWDLFKDHLDIIDDENRDVHYLLLKIDKIPQNYLHRYVSLVYDKLLHNPNVDVNKKCFELLNSISDDVVDDLDINFLKRGIEDTLFKDNDARDFCFKCIFHTNKTKQSMLLNHTLDIFENYVKAHWNDDTGNARSDVFDFINSFCNNCAEYKTENLVYLLYERWKTLFDYKDNLKEYLFLNFTLAYCRSSWEKFGQMVNGILSELVEMCDETIVDIFCTVLADCLLNTLDIDEEDELKEFLCSFSEGNKSSYIYIALVNLLGDLLDFESDLHVVKILQQCEMPPVQIYFNHYLSKV